MVFRKANRQTKVISEWQSRFEKKLRKLHGNHWKNVFHRLMKKSSTLKTTLKRRSKEYEVEFSMNLKEIREILLQAYGRKCRYCTKHLDINNIVCDHIIPLSLGGDSVSKNLQLICNRCNRRKGPLTHKQYDNLLKFLCRMARPAQDYILRKLSKSDVMGG
jgi:5-methylcytosine-specific restriction endonuclease McrA